MAIKFGNDHLGRLGAPSVLDIAVLFGAALVKQSPPMLVSMPKL